MQTKFNCPACSALIEHDGQSTLFQTCSVCNAPIIIPAEALKTNFSYSTSDSIPQKSQEDILSQIKDLLNQGRKVPAIKLYSEEFGVSVAKAKEMIEEMINEIESSIIINTPAYSDPQLELIKYEIRNGNKINAIRIYLETYGVGLKQAKDAVDLLEQNEKLNLVNHTEQIQDFSSQINRIKNEIRKGNKINAIKIFRETFEVTLLTAKETVEAIERGENIDFSQFPKNLN